MRTKVKSLNATRNIASFASIYATRMNGPVLEKQALGATTILPPVAEVTKDQQLLAKLETPAPQAKTFSQRIKDGWSRASESEAAETAKVFGTYALPPTLITATGWVGVGLERSYYDTHVVFDATNNGAVGAFFAGVYAACATLHALSSVKGAYEKAGDPHPTDRAMRSMLTWVTTPFVATSAVFAAANWSTLGADAGLTALIASGIAGTIGAVGSSARAIVRGRRAAAALAPPAEVAL